MSRPPGSANHRSHSVRCTKGAASSAAKLNGAFGIRGRATRVWIASEHRWVPWRELYRQFAEAFERFRMSRVLAGKWVGGDGIN